MLNQNGNFLGMLVLFKPSGHLSANILVKNLAYPEETTICCKFRPRDALTPWPQRVFKEKAAFCYERDHK